MLYYFNIYKPQRRTFDFRHIMIFQLINGQFVLQKITNNSTEIYFVIKRIIHYSFING